MSAEYLAKAHFSKQGYTISTPDCHESHHDFLADNLRVQVKAINELTSFNLARIRNKHGAKNKKYNVNDYDILAGVWVEKSRIYLFKSQDINNTTYGETISVAKLDGTKLSTRSRPLPYYEGNI